MLNNRKTIIGIVVLIAIVLLGDKLLPGPQGGDPVPYRTAEEEPQYIDTGTSPIEWKVPPPSTLPEYVFNDPRSRIAEATRISFQENPLFSMMREVIGQALKARGVAGVITSEEVRTGGIDVIEKIASGNYAIEAPQNLTGFQDAIAGKTLAAFLVTEELKEGFYHKGFLAGDVLSPERWSGPTFNASCAQGGYVIVPESMEVPPFDPMLDANDVDFDKCDAENRCCFVVSVASVNDIADTQDIYNILPGFCIRDNNVSSSCELPACKTLCEAAGGPGTAWIYSTKAGVCACGQPKYTATCEPDKAAGQCVLVKGGSGVSECSSNADCRTVHNICDEERCVRIAGPGFDECEFSSDCASSHSACRGDQCVRLPGSGQDQCDSDTDCPLTSYKTCVYQGLGGFCTTVLGKTAEGTADFCLSDTDCDGYITDFTDGDELALVINDPRSTQMCTNGAPPIEPAVVESFNNNIHRQPGSGHGWVRCQKPQCAVDLRPGTTSCEANAKAVAGVPIASPINGIVTEIFSLAPYGDCVVITSDGGPASTAKDAAVLCHISPTVTLGSTVSAGQNIGKLLAYGCPAGSFGPHLHFELKTADFWVMGDGFGGTWENQLTALQCVPQGDVGSLAQAILDHPSITLGPGGNCRRDCGGSSTMCIRTTPERNLTDTVSTGQVWSPKTSLSTGDIRRCGTDNLRLLALDPVLLQGILDFTNENCGPGDRFNILWLTGGDHVKNSFHYRAKAVDFNGFCGMRYGDAARWWHNTTDKLNTYRVLKYCSLAHMHVDTKDPKAGGDRLLNLGCGGPG